VSPSVSKLREFGKIKAVNTFETASTLQPSPLTVELSGKGLFPNPKSHMFRNSYSKLK